MAKFLLALLVSGALFAGCSGAANQQALPNSIPKTSGLPQAIIAPPCGSDAGCGSPKPGDPPPPPQQNCSYEGQTGCRSLTTIGTVRTNNCSAMTSGSSSCFQVGGTDDGGMRVLPFSGDASDCSHIHGGSLTRCLNQTMCDSYSDDGSSDPSYTGCMLAYANGPAKVGDQCGKADLKIGDSVWGHEGDAKYAVNNEYGLTGMVGGSVILGYAYTTVGGEAFFVPNALSINVYFFGVTASTAFDIGPNANAGSVTAVLDNSVLKGTEQHFDKFLKKSLRDRKCFSKSWDGKY